MKLPFKLLDVLELLPVVGPVIAKAPEFVKVYHQIVDTFDDKADQQTLKDALEDIHAENMEGSARLDAKLEAAKNR